MLVHHFETYAVMYTYGYTTTDTANADKGIIKRRGCKN